MQKGSIIHVMQTQVFLLGLAYGASRLNANKSETFPPIYYTTIKSTQKLASDGYVYIKIKKLMYSLKQAAVLACNDLVKILLLVIMYLENTIQAYGDMQ